MCTEMHGNRAGAQWMLSNCTIRKHRITLCRHRLENRPEREGEGPFLVYRLRHYVNGGRVLVLGCSWKKERVLGGPVMGPFCAWRPISGGGCRLWPRWKEDKKLEI